MQVVPDGWYLVLQVKNEPPNYDDVYESGRVNVRRCEHTGKIIEVWYFYTKPADLGGYPNGTKPRLIFRQLGAATTESEAVKAKLNSLQLVKQADPFVEPSIDYAYVIAICDRPVEVDVDVERKPKI